jgi:hypothetical protein
LQPIADVDAKTLVSRDDLHDAAAARRPAAWQNFVPRIQYLKESSMKLSPSDAALLSTSERQLVESKGPWHVKDLVRLIERTRRARDKARDLLQRQTVAKRRGKGAEKNDANARSKAKARVFERALERFSKQLAILDAESTRAMSALGADAAVPVAAGRNPRKAGASKPARKAARKTPKAASERTVKKSAAKRASAARKTAAKAAPKAASKAVGKTARGKSVKPAAKAAMGPRKAVSKKARIPLPRGGGSRSAQTVGQASRRTRAKKSARRG